MTSSTYQVRTVCMGVLAAFSVWAGAHCSSEAHSAFSGDDGSAGGGSGSGSGSSGGSGSATSGTTGSSGGGSGTPSTSSSGGSIGVSGSADGGTAAMPEAGDDSSSAPPDAGLAIIDGAVRACTPMPSPNPMANRAAECDYFLQSIDFEDHFGYPSPPSSIKVTNFGTAFGAYAINNCGPYCYAKNFTINVDIVGGGPQAQEQGEVIFEFPATGGGLPIPTAVGRDSLAWIILDGPTMPAFKITGQLVVETTTGMVTGPDTKQLAYHNWLLWQQAEFKYFGITATTFSGPPVNVTGIGFRIAGPANLPKGQEWHGVAYIDHLQIRTGGGPNNPTDAGAYPFGL